MEQSELEKLYEWHSKELMLYAIAFTKNKHDAEALVSDAFYRLALQESPPKNIKFWLFTVVKHQFIDTTRKKKRWNLSSLDKIQHKAIEPSYFKHEYYQDLYQALETLHSPYKEMILFYYFLDWPTREIAEFLSLSPNQVRVGLHRSRHLLKEELNHDDYF